MAGIESIPPRQSYGRDNMLRSREGSMTCDDGKDIPLSYNQAIIINGACYAIASILGMGGSRRLILSMVSEMMFAIGEPNAPEEKVKPVNGPQSRFICATPKCEGKLSEAARARERCDPRFKPRICTECYHKDARTENTTVGETAGITMPLHLRSVGRDTSVPIVMQVSTAAPKKKLKAGLKTAKRVQKEKIGTWSAKLARQPVARNVTFSMTINPDGSGNDGPLLSAQFETLDGTEGEEGEADGVGTSDCSQRSEGESDDMEGESAEEGENEDSSSTSQGNGDDNGPSEEEGEALEGEGSGEVEGKDVSSTSQGNGDDDRSDKQPYYKYEDYTDAIGRIRTHLTIFLGDSALSEIVAVLDSFKDKIADPVMVIRPVRFSI